MSIDEWIFSGDLFGKLSNRAKKYVLQNHQTISLFCEKHKEYFKLNNNKKKNFSVKLKRMDSLRYLISKIPTTWIECGTLFSTFSFKEKNDIYENYGKFLKFVKTFPNEIQLYSNEFSHYIKTRESFSELSSIEEIERKIKSKFENTYEGKLIERCDKKSNEKCPKQFVKENFELLFFRETILT
eukprot:gene9497-1703_t